MPGVAVVAEVPDRLGRQEGAGGVGGEREDQALDPPLACLPELGRESLELPCRDLVLVDGMGRTVPGPPSTQDGQRVELPYSSCGEQGHTEGWSQFRPSL